MAAYTESTLAKFIHLSPSEVIGLLQQAYSRDGFSSQYTRQTKAWARAIPELQQSFREVIDKRADAATWHVLLEYPLYRLRRRIDLVILTESSILVVECKVGANSATAHDRRQVEEYALDLRDFHAASHGRVIIPILWSTGAEPRKSQPVAMGPQPIFEPVAEVGFVGSEGLTGLLCRLSEISTEPPIDPDAWNHSPYKPVPNVVEAATSIFSGHNVRSIANFEADNLRSASARLTELIQQARTQKERYLLILTGVPGSGKTLAGLDVVHTADSGIESRGDIVYLSGNTPLVVVLREALALDEARRNAGVGKKRSLDDIRLQVRARIQHINDFLQAGFKEHSELAPHEHVIVFDEAQRAWDEKQGFEKFERLASEPTLLLELMSRHPDWCVCVCLIGTGQEINSGEEGLLGWGDALRKMNENERRKWKVFAPAEALSKVTSRTSTFGEMPPDVIAKTECSTANGAPEKLPFI